MRPTSIDSPTLLSLVGQSVKSAHDRQALISGFDQQRYSSATILFVGAGGLTSHVAPVVTRKGIGAIRVVDDDRVDPTNLSRQFFIRRDIGQYKSHAMLRNLEPVCTAKTRLYGYAFTFQDAVSRGLDLSCDVAICCVDNNPGRKAVSQHFRRSGIPVVHLAVSADADHGYVFIEERGGPCIACLFPDMASDEGYPCPGTPAVADILATVGGMAAYAIDTVLMSRKRDWNYRSVYLSSGASDAAGIVRPRPDCKLCCIGRAPG